MTVRTWLLTTAVIAVLTGCDTTRAVVDAVNPVNWFAGDETNDSENTEPKPVPGGDRPYPAIGTVPERPGEPAIKREYPGLVEGLAADRQNALYSDEAIRRESPPSRAGKPPRPVVPPSRPPTAGSIAPPEVPSTVQPPPAPAPTPARPARQTAAPKPAPTPQPPTARNAGETQTARPVPAPEPLRQDTIAPQPASAPPPSAAGLAGNTPQAAAAAVPTRTQMIATIYFPSGSAALTERDRGILQQVARIYRRDNGKRVVIVGHSSRKSTSGSQSKQALVNYKVSLDRAAAIGQALVQYGIDNDRIVIDARGATELKYSEETTAGEAGNRRAEVFLQY